MCGKTLDVGRAIFWAIVVRYTDTLYSIGLATMFLGVDYEIDGVRKVVAVGDINARLPVATRGGGYRLMELGHGEPFADNSPGLFHSWPAGDTVPLDILHKPTGLWHRWHSSVTPVKIAVARFWYSEEPFHINCKRDLRPGQFLQGALLTKDLVQRVYFVVVPQPGAAPDADCWWPRVVGGYDK